MKDTPSGDGKEAESEKTKRPSSARAHRWKRWRRPALFALLAVGVVALLVWVLRPAAVPVDTALVQQGAMQVTVNENGKARFQERYEVSAPLSGTLARVRLQPGDFVQAGQEISRIHPLPSPLLDARSHAQAQARVAAALAEVGRARTSEDRAQAALVEARQRLQRQNILLAEATGSPAEVELAAAALRAQEADLRAARFGTQVAMQELESARVALARAEGAAPGEVVPVRSPVSGRVLRVIQESEAAVQAGTPILEIGDPGAVELVVDILSTDAVRVRPGARAEIERWGGPGVLRASVRRVEPVAFTQISALGIEEQRVNVVLDLEDPRPRWDALGDGYRVEARIAVWEQDNVVIAPVSAIFRDGDGWAAFRVERGRARKVPLQVGERSAVAVQVLAGLVPGDEVVTYPSDRVVDGVRVDRR